MFACCGIRTHAGKTQLDQECNALDHSAKQAASGFISFEIWSGQNEREIDF